MANKRFFNLIILDASGSMESIYTQALTGLNETIQTIRSVAKEHDNLDQFLTLVSFNHEAHTIHETQLISMVDDIRRDQYVAEGCTALLDAMGNSITALQSKVQPGEGVLVTIITDGMENASRQWTGQRIKSLVSELRQAGWTFNYIGANQDVDMVADEIGIHNRMTWQTDPEEAKAMFSKLKSSSMRFFGRNIDNIQNCCISEDKDFFNED